MRRLEKNWVCENCNILVAIEADELLDTNDWKYTSEGKPIEWVEIEILDKMPYIIAHEYYRIKTLLEEKQPYGSIMQLKDAYECLVKFLVLRECSRIYRKKKKTDSEIMVLKVLTEKLLLLSNWKNMLSVIKDFPEIGTETKAAMEDIILLLQEGVKVIEWRNRIIGHGALGYAEDLNNKNEFYKILDGLTNHLKQYHGVYEKIEFGIFLEDKKCFYRLAGTELKYCKEGNYDFLAIKSGNNFESLSPFIIWYEKEIYFFDSYSSNKKNTDIISYTLGKKESIRKKHKLSEVCGEITELHNACQEKISKLEIKAHIHEKSDMTSIEDEAYLAETEKWLLKSYERKDSIKTVYLEKWLQMNLKLEKGVFLFRACAETGKTTASMQLENRINNGISIADTTVKVIYINEANNHIGYILDKIQLVLTSDSDGKNIVRQSKPIYLSPTDNVEVRKKEFANYLGNMKRMLTKMGECNKKLLIVFDGIDELSDNDLNFFEYIPEADELDNGIFILLTCRTDNELSKLKQNTINKIRFNDVLIKSQEDEDIQEMHREYITKQLPKLSETAQEQVMNTGERSFLQIYLITFMLKNQMFTIEELLQITGTEQIIERYLDYLQNLYGNISTGLMEKTIYLLASDMDARALEDISYQVGEEKVSFDLIGILHDLRVIFHVNHRVAKTFCVNHEKKKEAIFSYLETNKRIVEIEAIFKDIWTDRLQEISYWDEVKLQNFSSEQYSECLDSMMEISTKMFYFLRMFFRHPLVEKEWENDSLDSKAFLVILEKLFGGPNSYLYSKEWVWETRNIAQNMSEFIERNFTETENEEVRASIEIIIVICKAFSNWRDWFVSLKWNGKLPDFRMRKSELNEIYEVITIFYDRVKSDVEDKERKNLSQSLYNLLILLEQALLKLVDDFSEFYSELEMKKEILFWAEKKTELIHGSTKLYDLNMRESICFEEFKSLYKLAIVYNNEGNEQKKRDTLLAVDSLKKELNTYNLNAFDKLTIEREALYYKMESLQKRDIDEFQYIPKEVIPIASKLVNVIEQQIKILRKEQDEGARDDEVSESVWNIADNLNYFVLMGAVINKERNLNNALKLGRMANFLYEMLTEKMQGYYLLQRVNVVANYTLLLNLKDDNKEQGKYIDWYLKNKSEIMELISTRSGKICEIAEHGTWLMDSIVASHQKKSVKEVHKKIFCENYFEVHNEEDGEIRVRCKGNFNSTKVFSTEKGLRVKFNKKFCNKCEYASCPAHKGTHVVII